MFKLIFAGLATVLSKATKIVAVGDSITEGQGSSDESTHSWPAQLHDILKDEDKYTVQNLGVRNSTMIKNSGDWSYWNKQAYQDALNSEADIIILMLGSNDAKSSQWNQTAFVSDYLEMATNFKNLESKPDLFLMIAPPLYWSEDKEQ